MLCPYKFTSGGMIVMQVLPGNKETGEKRRGVFAANPDTCGCEGEKCAVWDDKSKTCSFKNKS